MEFTTFDQYITEAKSIKYYHATYRPLLKTIKREGLGGKSAIKAWTDSKPGVVYISSDPDVAESYAEISELVPDELLDDIVILEIDGSRLKSSKIFKDSNVRSDEDSMTFEYHGKIPWKYMKIL